MASPGHQGEFFKNQGWPEEASSNEIASDSCRLVDGSDKKIATSQVQTDLGHDPDLEIQLSLVDPKGHLNSLQ